MNIDKKGEFYAGLAVVIVGVIISFILFYGYPEYLLLGLCIIGLAWLRYLGQLSKKYFKEKK